MSGLSGLDPEFRPWAKALVDACGGAGLLPRVTSGLRTHSEQSRLYQKFLAGQTPFTVAPPGHSAHELGLAFDMVVTPMDRLSDVGDLWESWGGIWGGHYGDIVHFEYPGAAQAASQDALGSTEEDSPISQVLQMVSPAYAIYKHPAKVLSEMDLLAMLF